MKPKDLAVIGGAIIIGIIVSIFVSKAVFVKSNSSQSVDVVPSLPSNFAKPNPMYFNKKSIDPTRFITISNSSNTAPFPTSSNQN